MSARTSFQTEIGNLGADIAYEIALDLGIQFGFIHRGGSQINVQGFLSDDLTITKEFILDVMTGMREVEFFFPQQPTNAPIFPPADGVEINDVVIWTPFNNALKMAVHKIEDIGNFNTMTMLTCRYALAKQIGAVGIK